MQCRGSLPHIPLGSPTLRQEPFAHMLFPLPRLIAMSALVSYFLIAQRPSPFRPRVGINDFISRRAQDSLALRPVSLQPT